jgi:hypothetical protein
LLINEKQRLDDFKKSFLYLLEKAKQKINIKEEVHRGTPKIPKVRKIVDTGMPPPYSAVFENKLHLMIALSVLYRHFIGIYYIGSLFTWPEKIKNKEDLNRLYEIVFRTIQEIQSKLTDVLPRRDDNTHTNPFTKKMLENLFELSPPLVPLIIDAFEKCGLEKELQPTLETLWSAPFAFISYETLADFLQENTGGKFYKVNNWKDLAEVIEVTRRLIKWQTSKGRPSLSLFPHFPHFQL